MGGYPGPSSASSRLLLITAATMAACTWSDRRNEYRQPYEPAFEVTASSVANGQDQVPRNTEIRIGFSDRPDPATLSSTSAPVTAGRLTIAAAYRTNLVRCEAVIRPAEPLTGSLTYTLTVDEPLASFTGATLAEPFLLTFTTSDDLDEPPIPPTADGTEVHERVFGPHCGCCHSPSGPYASVLTLDPVTVVGQESRQVPSTEVVKAGTHSQSYLMHKVLALPTIVGDPMPPPYGELACTEPWPASRACGAADELVELLAAWIDGLAP